MDSVLGLLAAIVNLLTAVILYQTARRDRKKRKK